MVCAEEIISSGFRWGERQSRWGGNEPYLVGLVAHDGADNLLNHARGRVDVRLKSGRVVVRHGDC